jgi:hypothetical protein
MVASWSGPLDEMFRPENFGFGQSDANSKGCE